MLLLGRHQKAFDERHLGPFVLKNLHKIRNSKGNVRKEVSGTVSEQLEKKNITNAGDGKRGEREIKTLMEECTDNRFDEPFVTLQFSISMRIN